ELGWGPPVVEHVPGTEDRDTLVPHHQVHDLLKGPPHGIEPVLLPCPRHWRVEGQVDVRQEDGCYLGCRIFCWHSGHTSPIWASNCFWSVVTCCSRRLTFVPCCTAWLTRALSLLVWSWARVTWEEARSTGPKSGMGRSRTRPSRWASATSPPSFWCWSFSFCHVSPCTTAKLPMAWC